MGKEATEKITLVGAGCVGKTTLFNGLKSLVQKPSPDTVFVDEVGRDFFQQNPTPQDKVFSLEIQMRIQDLILEREKEAHSAKPALIVCDRSVLDSAVHLKAMGDNNGSRKLLERVLFWLPTYSYFLLLDPKDVPYQQDGVRTESEETRSSIHQAFIEFFQENNIAYRLLSGTLEERLRIVRGIIDEK